MGRRKKREREQELEGVNLLSLIPMRMGEWEESEGRIVLLRPPPSTTGFRGLLDRFFHKLSASRIRLDEVGGFAWSHFDGRRTVAEVAELMVERFGEEVDPVEERLGRFVWVMRREGLLAYPGWDEEN